MFYDAMRPLNVHDTGRDRHNANPTLNSYQYPRTKILYYPHSSDLPPGVPSPKQKNAKRRFFYYVNLGPHTAQAIQPISWHTMFRSHCPQEFEHCPWSLKPCHLIVTQRSQRHPYLWMNCSMPLFATWLHTYSQYYYRRHHSSHLLHWLHSLRLWPLSPCPPMQHC